MSEEASQAVQDERRRCATAARAWLGSPDEVVRHVAGAILSRITGAAAR